MGYCELSDKVICSVDNVHRSTSNVEHSVGKLELGYCELSDKVICYVDNVDRSTGKVELGYHPPGNADHCQGSALPYRPSASSDGNCARSEVSRLLIISMKKYIFYKTYDFCKIYVEMNNCLLYLHLHLPIICKKLR